MISPVNNHDSIKLVEVVDGVSDYFDDDMIKQIMSVYAGKGYDTKFLREYLQKRKIHDCISYRTNSKEEHDDADQNNFNKTRFVVERLFAWLKNGLLQQKITISLNKENTKKLKGLTARKDVEAVEMTDIIISGYLKKR